MNNHLSTNENDSIKICSGYQPGLVGRVTEIHDYLSYFAIKQS